MLTQTRHAPILGGKSTVTKGDTRAQVTITNPSIPAAGEGKKVFNKLKEIAYKKYPWLRPPDPKMVSERWRIVREFGPLPVLRCKLQNKWEWFRYTTYLDRKERPLAMPFLFPRERRLMGLVASTAALMFFFVPTEQTAGMEVELPDELVSQILAEETAGYSVDIPQPKNWLSGEAKLTGSKEAVMGAYQYATVAGYTFVASEASRQNLIQSGSLVKLEGPYLELIDVSEPYVMPVVAAFANRLGQQYAAQGCGKLKVTSALRSLATQGALPNGSTHSVHPTGMSIDLRRETPATTEESFCLKWLNDTLTAVEADKRIDVTAENAPRHFHVVVVPDAYEAWLKNRTPALDPEVEALAKALYFEAAFNESGDGYRAIAAVIKNRVRSSEFPNTILEVVAEGAAGRNSGSCQFSFMCDGRGEDIQILCGEHPEDMRQYWHDKCQNRWDAMVKAATYLISANEDPTGGAVLYYTGKAPYWAKSDMRSETIRKIGSHWFGCSKHRGDDVCITSTKGGRS
jgi:hypothetical protein